MNHKANILHICFCIRRVFDIHQHVFRKTSSQSCYQICLFIFIVNKYLPRNVSKNTHFIHKTHISTDLVIGITSKSTCDLFQMHTRIQWETELHFTLECLSWRCICANSRFVLMQSGKQQVLVQEAGLVPFTRDIYTEFLFPKFGIAYFRLSWAFQE